MSERGATPEEMIAYLETTLASAFNSTRKSSPEEIGRGMAEMYNAWAKAEGVDANYEFTGMDGSEAVFSVDWEPKVFSILIDTNKKTTKGNEMGARKLLSSVPRDWLRISIYADGMGGTEESYERDGRYVLAEDAIQREAELLARIQQLEERAAAAIATAKS